jgi:hypothetical protein
MIKKIAFVSALTVLGTVRVAHAAEPTPGVLGGFVDLEWRAMGMASHLSHGPGSPLA